MSEKKDNPFPPGSAAALTYVDSEKVTAQIENAAAYAEAARAEFEAQAAQPDPATVAAAAASEAAYRIGLDQLERDRMLAEAQAEQAALLDARLRRLGG